MKNSKHTPGPWKIEGHSTVNVISYATVKGRKISSLLINTQEDLMNSHLIAAAPDMLEALIQSRGLIIQLCNDIKSNYGLDLDVNTLIRVRGIDDAIAKAQGES